LPEISRECNGVLPTDGWVAPSGGPTGPYPPLKPGQESITHDPIPGAPILYVPADVAARSAKEFDVFYDFDNDFTQYPIQQNRVIQIMEYSQKIHASHIQVTAYRGATLLSGGKVLVENAMFAARRSSNLLAIMDAYGIPSAMISAEVRTEPGTAKGEGDDLNRRVHIAVVP
jgi:hypothetical protein